MSQPTAVRDPSMSLSPPQLGTGVPMAVGSGGVETDFASFYKKMEHNMSRSLTHQRSMIEVPQGILNLKNELDDDNDVSAHTDEDYDDSQNNDDHNNNNTNNNDNNNSTTMNTTASSDGNKDTNTAATATTASSKDGTKKSKSKGGSNNNNNNNNYDDGNRSSVIEIKDNDSNSDEEESFDLDDGDLDMNTEAMQKAIRADDDPNLSSEDDEMSRASRTQTEQDNEFSHSRDRSTAKIEIANDLNVDTNNNNGAPPGVRKQLSTGKYDNKRGSEIETPTSPTDRHGSVALRTFKSRKHTIPENNDNSNENTESKTDNNNNNNDNNDDNDNDKGESEKDSSVALKEKTPEAIKKRSSTKRRSTRSVHRATIANGWDDDEAKSDDDFNTFSPGDDEGSLTLEVDVETWKRPQDGEFEECDLRFDEDDIQGGKKPPASEFRNLKLFFHFFYDRFHHNGALLLESTLPTYTEWKTSRKVKFRNAAIKRIDHCLKACNESVHSLRALCYNCVLLCHDAGQNMTINYAGCQAPKINPCTFEVGPYSIVSCWDLFELGASPSSDDWRRALSDDCVAQFLVHAQPDLRHFDKEQRKEQYTFQIIKKYQLYCLAEHMNNFVDKTQFGASMEWKKIKSQFLKKCDKDVLNAIDHYTYFLNPKVDSLASVLSDTSNSVLVASKRKIVCEPVLWLIYVGYFLLDRQQKLTELVLSSFGFADNTTKVKGQKLKTMIDNLGKQAKEESERLRKIMARLPSQEDLQKTFELEITERDPSNKSIYTRSFKKDFVVSTKASMTEIVKDK